MLGKVCSLKSYWICTKILSGHKKTHIYAAVGRIFEILIFSKNINLKKNFYEKLNFLVNFQNVKIPPHSSIDIRLLMN